MLAQAVSLQKLYSGGALFDSVATSECNYCALISDFCRGVNGIFALLGCYRAQIHRFLSKLRGNLSAQNSKVKQIKLECLNFEYGTDNLSQNVDNKLPMYDA